MSKKNHKPHTKTKPKLAVTTTVTVPTAIKDLYTLGNQGIILLKQDTIQELYTKSGKTAIGNEFQTHYWFLNYRLQAQDGSILDIAVPTVYFNYAQEVSGAAIDFDLKDVKELSEKLEPVHNMKVNELQSLGLAEKLSKLFNAELKCMSADYGSIHRHPGSSKSQSFSATDLTNTAREPGVVYPLATAKDDTPNFAGIMAIDAGVCNVAHYEYRTVNGTLGTDIEYVEGRCSAVTIRSPKPDSRSIIEKLLSYPVETVTNYWKHKRSSLQPEFLTAMEELGETLYLKQGFSASTDLVLPDHLSEKSYTYNRTGFGGYGATYTQPRIGEDYTPLSKEQLEKMTLLKLNDHLKVCTKMQGSWSTPYRISVDVAITDILKVQAEIKQMMMDYTEDAASSV